MSKFKLKWPFKSSRAKLGSTNQVDASIRKALKRGYNAGKTNRLNVGWQTSEQSADAEIYGDLGKVRERARDLERNETTIVKWLHELESNVIGSDGIKLRSEPMNPDGTFDQMAKDAIEWAWYHQGKIANWMVCKDITEVDADQLAIRSIARDGELLIRIIKGYDNQFKFAIQYIEPDQLDVTYNAIAPNGNVIRMSVELNEWMVPTAYWILTDHPGDNYFVVKSGGKFRHRVPAKEIRFPFRKTRAGQTRGMSWMVQSIDHLQMLGGYEEAELVRARTTASKMGFFESENGENYGAVDPNNPDADFAMEAEPGLMEQLPGGLKFTSWDPKSDTGAFTEYRKALLRRVASGLTMSYNTLANDLEGVNYTSLRDGKLTERDGYKVLQNWYINTVKRPIFLEWLQHVLDFGLIKMNNGQGSPLPASKFDKFAEHSFIPRRWAWVDPLKDAAAQVLTRDNGWISDSQIVAEQGREFDNVLDQRVADQKLMEDKGISMGGDDEAKREFESLKSEADAYGVAVRAGSITPQPADEQAYRAKAGLSVMSKDVQDAWTAEGGVRRPITLVSGKESEAAIEDAGGADLVDEDANRSAMANALELLRSQAESAGETTEEFDVLTKWIQTTKRK